MNVQIGSHQMSLGERHLVNLKITSRVCKWHRDEIKEGLGKQTPEVIACVGLESVTESFRRNSVFEVK